MFTVEDKYTGEKFVVYAVQGVSFLVYDKDIDYWTYQNMDRFRPAKPKDDLQLALKQLRQNDCEYCRYEELGADDYPCRECRGAGGPNDKWEWAKPKGE